MQAATTARPRPFTPFYPPSPRPWLDQPALLRRVLQIRRNMLPTWGPPAYEAMQLSGKFLGRRNFLVNDPDAIRHVLVDNAANYGRTAGTYRILRPIFGDGLLLSDGEAWRFQRRTAAPAFVPRSLDIVAQVAAAKTAEMCAGWRAPYDVVDLLSAVQALALDVAGEAMFSQSLRSHVPALRREIMQYGINHGRPFILDLLLPGRVPSPQDLARRRFSERWFGLIEEIIAERRELPPADPPRDLFELLATARDPASGRGFSDTELRDQIATMILAGHETTALTLFWACYLLSQAPDIQEAAAAEATAADPSPEAAPAVARNLPLLRAIVDETLRLYPAAFTIVREALEADRLGDDAVDKGDYVIIAPWVLHRHRAFWSDPLRFDPNRFMPGAPPPPRYAYLPFGTGPRVCIGAQFALNEAVTVLAQLLRRRRIELVGNPWIKPVAVVTVYPARRPAFRLTERARPG